MSLPKKRILIIDDEINILKSLQRILEEDYEAVVASGGQFALDILAQQNGRCDVVLCDLSMPIISGANVYQLIAEKYPGLEALLDSHLSLSFK